MEDRNGLYTNFSMVKSWEVISGKGREGLWAALAHLLVELPFSIEKKSRGRG